jgi:hypothetical protein
LSKYKVKVTCTYPVEAVDARDALSTVPMVVKMRYIGGHAEGSTEIIDADSGGVVLKAVLNPEIRKEANSSLK